MCDGQRSASFELTPPDAAEMARRRQAVLEAGHPYLVAELDGRVAGYCYASAFRPRPAYAGTVEDTVYVADREVVVDAILDTLSNNNNRFNIDGVVEDQRFRQFGFSNSDSDKHLDQIMNDPNDLRGVAQGDRVETPVEGISDWMYSLNGRVYGAWTVNAIRAAMDPEERASHDAMWGLEFGDPAEILLCADYGGPEAEHPMSENMAPGLAEQLAQHPERFLEPDERGWTQLHRHALGGSLAICRVLLEHGADPTLTTADGRTALDLARALGWERVEALLSDGA